MSSAAIGFSIIAAPQCSGTKTCGPSRDSARALSDHSRSSSDRTTAAHCLGDVSVVVDETMATALAQALTDPDPKVRAAAEDTLRRKREALGTLEAPYASTSQTLVAVLGSEDMQARAAAASALVTFADPSALEAVNGAVVDASNTAQIRNDAALTLVRIAHRRVAAIPGLRYALRQHPRPGVRMDAADQLGAMRSVAIDAVPDLVAAVEKDADNQVQNAAARALGSVAGGTQGPNTEKAGAAILAYAKKPRPGVVPPAVVTDAFASLGDAGVPYLRELLESNDWLLRGYGLRALMNGAVGESGKPTFSEASKATLQPTIRRIAAQPLPADGAQLVYARDAHPIACRYLKAFDPAGLPQTCPQYGTAK